MSDLNRIEANNAELRECIEIAESLPDAGSGGGELPTLFTPTIKAVGTQINIEDDSANGNFTEKYEIYNYSNTKVAETSEKRKDLVGIVDNDTLVYVIAVADCFNQSGASNSVVISSGEFAYQLKYYGYEGYGITGRGTMTAENLVFPSTYQDVAVTAIGSNSFQNDTTLKSVYIPDSVTHVWNLAFADCTNLETVRLSKSLTTLYTWCFRKTAIKEIELHEGIKDMWKGVFQETKLTSIKIPSTVTKLESYVFLNCYFLEYVDLTAYGTDATFPTLEYTDAFANCGRDTAKGTFEIRVVSGAKAKLAGMTNWSAYADNIVEV